MYTVKVPSLKPRTNCEDGDCDTPLAISKAAQVTVVVLSVGLKCFSGVPLILRSCIKMVGGEAEADKKTSPLSDTATTLGGEGCEWQTGSEQPVVSE